MQLLSFTFYIRSVSVPRRRVSMFKQMKLNCFKENKCLRLFQIPLLGLLCFPPFSHALCTGNRICSPSLVTATKYNLLPNSSQFHCSTFYNNYYIGSFQLQYLAIIDQSEMNLQDDHGELHRQCLTAAQLSSTYRTFGVRPT